MGMTNEQFDSYKVMLLRRLKRAEKALINSTDEEKEQLREIIEDLEHELNKV